MDGAGPTWILMTRDVSHAVRIRDQPHLVATLILDADTGLARGISVAPTARRACAEAIQTALTTPAGPLPAQPPGHVLCGAHTGDVLAELTRLLPGPAAPALTETGPIHEAEDIFDSFIGHMAGRRQPDDPPLPPDWQHLFTQASHYCQAQPWLRWSDADHLDLILNIDDAPARYVAVIIGQAGIQRGLVLYPGAVIPDHRPGRHPGDRHRGDTPTTGTLMLWLDPPDEVPAEFTAKAARYGWPDNPALTPLLLTITADEPADIGRRGAQHLTLATAGVLAHDQHHPTPGTPPRKTTGTLPLTDAHQATYTIN